MGERKHLQALRRVLCILAGKAAAALPCTIGSVVSWLMGMLGKTATWLAEICGTSPLLLGPCFSWCSGLATAVETTAKTLLGRLLFKRLRGPFFLLHGPSPANRSAELALVQQTCRRHSSRAKAVAPCEQSRLVGRPGMPHRLRRRDWSAPLLSVGCVRLPRPIRLSG